MFSFILQSIRSFSLSNFKFMCKRLRSTSRVKSFSLSLSFLLLPLGAYDIRETRCYILLTYLCTELRPS
jgi:hypothetical protein